MHTHNEFERSHKQPQFHILQLHNEGESSFKVPKKVLGYPATIAPRYFFEERSGQGPDASGLQLTPLPGSHNLLPPAEHGARAKFSRLGSNKNIAVAKVSPMSPQPGTRLDATPQSTSRAPSSQGSTDSSLIPLINMYSLDGLPGSGGSRRSRRLLRPFIGPRNLLAVVALATLLLLRVPQGTANENIITAFQVAPTVVPSNLIAGEKAR